MRELVQQNGPAALAIGGLLIGLAFGVIVLRSNFCTMGSISDVMLLGDYRRLRSWLLASGVALVGTQALAASDVVPLAASIYLGPRLNWLGHIIGGLMFGYGMVFAGGCASRNLARVGGGDLRALMTLLVMGLFAYMTIGGVLAPARAWMEQATSADLARLGLASQGLGDILGLPAAIGAARGRLIATVAVAGAIAVYCLKDRAFRRSPLHLAAGVGVGLCSVAGWALTGLAFDEFEARPLAPASLTYVRPTGDTIEWLERFTAQPMPGFGVATVLGTIVGALAAAKASGRFRLTSFSDIGDTRRCLLGAALMGVGGVMALGCTIGQAVTGLSTLAAGSFLTFAAIVAGGIAGMRRLTSILAAET